MSKHFNLFKNVVFDRNYKYIEIENICLIVIQNVVAINKKLNFNEKRCLKTNAFNFCVNYFRYCI